MAELQIGRPSVGNPDLPDRQRLFPWTRGNMYLVKPVNVGRAGVGEVLCYTPAIELRSEKLPRVTKLRPCIRRSLES